jgi:hypothetical protein
MTMKRAELEKRKALAIANAQRSSGHRYRPAPADRKAQRAADRAAGLVPFAVKLPAALVAELNAHALRTGVPVGEAVAALLRSALACRSGGDEGH